MADFCEPVSLPPGLPQQRMGFFPGSTIGNFAPAAAVAFLRNAGESLGHRSYLLIGVDTKKSPEQLHRAYNDSRGLTARFNLNILHRINRELDGDFDLQSFEHYAFYNAPLGRVEMHLVSLGEQSVHVGGKTIALADGESIHTENSYKYTPQEFLALAESAGWQSRRSWHSAEAAFGLHLLQFI